MEVEGLVIQVRHQRLHGPLIRETANVVLELGEHRGIRLHPEDLESQRRIPLTLLPDIRTNVHHTPHLREKAVPLLHLRCRSRRRHDDAAGYPSPTHRSTGAAAALPRIRPWGQSGRCQSLRVTPLSRNPTWLLERKHDVYSQTGEDGVIEAIFEVIAPGEDPWCVEFGAWDGIHLTNTRHLIESRGFSAVLIEAEAARFRELEANYRGNDRVTTLNRSVGFTAEDGLDAILRETPIPRAFDLLSIDIDIDIDRQRLSRLAGGGWLSAGGGGDRVQPDHPHPGALRPGGGPADQSRVITPVGSGLPV